MKTLPGYTETRKSKKRRKKFKIKKSERRGKRDG